MAERMIDAHWRDSARMPKLFVIDARSAFPLLLFLVHIRLWSFILALLITVFFGVIEHYGFSALVFFRASRSFFAGKIKQARPWWRQDRCR